MYFAASFGVAIMMLLLRFGPRSFDSHDDDSQDEDMEDNFPSGYPTETLKNIVVQTDSVHGSSRPRGGSDGGGAVGYGSTADDLDASQVSAQESTPMMRGRREARSIRRRAALASVV
jgi:hypothetical protein